MRKPLNYSDLAVYEMWIISAQVVELFALVFSKCLWLVELEVDNVSNYKHYINKLIRGFFALCKAKVGVIPILHSAYYYNYCLSYYL